MLGRNESTQDFHGWGVGKSSTQSNVCTSLEGGGDLKCIRQTLPRWPVIASLTFCLPMLSVACPPTNGNLKHEGGSKNVQLPPALLC